MAKIIRNWGYMGPGTPNRRYDTTVGQLMNGFPVGILQLWAHLPFFPGNVSNAYTYDFPVKFLEVKGSGIDNILAGDMSLVDDIMWRQQSSWRWTAAVLSAQTAASSATISAWLRISWMFPAISPRWCRCRGRWLASSPRRSSAS